MLISTPPKKKPLTISTVILPKCSRLADIRAAFRGAAREKVYLFCVLVRKLRPEGPGGNMPKGQARAKRGIGPSLFGGWG